MTTPGGGGEVARALVLESMCPFTCQKLKNALLSPELPLYFPELPFYFPELPFHFPEVPFNFPEMPLYFSKMPCYFPQLPFNFLEMPSFYLLCAFLSKNDFFLLIVHLPCPAQICSEIICLAFLFLLGNKTKLMKNS